MLEQAETFETIISTSRLRNQEKEQIIINPKAKRRRKYRVQIIARENSRKTAKINETKAWF